MPESDQEAQGSLQHTGDLLLPQEKSAVTPKKRKRKQDIFLTPPGRWSYIILLTLWGIAFAPLLQSDLLWPEYDMVERSPYKSMEHWHDAWNLDSIRSEDPLTLTSYFAETLISLPPAQVHRAINIVLHLFAAVTLLRILESLKVPGALAATLFFTLHPASIQTLFWPGYRNEITGLIFILLAIYFGIRSAKAVHFFIMLFFSAIAASIHSAAIAIPALIGLGIFYQKYPFRITDYNRILPVLCIVVFIGTWTHSGKTLEANTDSINQLTIIGENLFFFLRQSLIPVESSLFIPFSIGEDYSVGAQNSLLPILIFAPFYVLIAINCKKQFIRGLLLGLTAFLLLMIHGVTQTGQFVDGDYAKETHGLYVALPAIVALVTCSIAAIFRHISPSSKVAWSVSVGIFLLLQISITSSLTYAVSDTPNLWKNMARQWPESWVPKAALISAVQESGNTTLLNEKEMIQTLITLLAQNPDRYHERIILARIYRDAGELTSAVREFRLVLRDTEPENEILEEAASLFDKAELRREAINARERVKPTE